MRFQHLPLIYQKLFHDESQFPMGFSCIFLVNQHEQYASVSLLISLLVNLKITSINLPESALYNQIRMNVTTNYNLLLQMGPITNNYPTLALQQQQNVIKILSLALKNSISAYGLKYQPNTQINNHSIQPKLQAKASQPQVIEILSDDDEFVPIKQNKEFLQSQGFKKSYPPATNVRPHPKANEQTPTNEEMHHQEVALSKAAKTKSIKKGKNERRQCDFHVQVPEVDQIDVAYLPETGLSRSALSKLSQALMRRRVYEWIHPAKKQKKQVRLLKQ